MDEARATSADRNPQADMMADESMVRTLASQAQAIWPQEQALLARYGLSDDCQILDVGCGTGEISARLARHYGGARVTGIDVLAGPLTIARGRYPDVAGRLGFEVADAFDLPFADSSFDLSVCRHMLQAVPDPDKVLTELIRVTRPGGWLHVLSEDYGMLHMTPGSLDPDLFWQLGTVQFAQRTGTDARFGRRTWSVLRALGMEDLRVDYVIVDTLRVSRAVFADIMVAWRDGYSEALAAHSALDGAAIRQHFDEIIASIHDVGKYAVWFVPIVSGRIALRR